MDTFASAYRSLFPVTQTHCFLNNAAVSPLATTVVDAMNSHLEDRMVSASKSYPRWVSEVEQARSQAARLVNAAPGEIAFLGNTSQGLSAVAAGIRWKPGDRMVAVTPDFPSNIYPWMNLENKKVTIDFARRDKGRIHLEDIGKLLHPSTRLVAISSVDYGSGFLADLKGIGRLCRQNNIIFCVDAIQSLGAVPLDVQAMSIDCLAAGGHKWLLGPMGIGLFYVSKDIQDRIDTPFVGWKSVEEEENFEPHFDLKKSALRFECGTLNLPGIMGLKSSLSLLLKADVHRIHAHILSINDAFYNGLTDRGYTVTSPWKPGERSGILTFLPKNNPEQCFRDLSERSVMVSLRNGLIRIAPHLYTDHSDVDAFFQALDEIS